jgi:hypothetical protein
VNYYGSLSCYALDISHGYSGGMLGCPVRLNIVSKVFILWMFLVSRDRVIDGSGAVLDGPIGDVESGRWGTFTTTPLPLMIKNV